MRPLKIQSLDIMTLCSFVIHNSGFNAILPVKCLFSSFFLSSVGCFFFRIYPSIFRQMSLSLAILWAFSMVLIPFNLSCFLSVARYVFLDFPLGFLTGFTTLLLELFGL